MYRKDSTGWIKHVDFIILDLICLQVAFVLAYALSGYGANPYQLILYRNMAVFMEVADLVVLFAMGTLKNVLKRGYYKDFVVTAQHGVILGACLLLYLFMLQEGQQYSRLALVLNIVIYILLTYLVRELWKHLLRKKMEDGENRSLLLVVSADVVSAVVESMKEHNYARYKIAGIAVIDKEMTGKYVNGVKVVANMENAAEYVCKEWIDEVLIVTSGVVPYPKELIEQFTETGVTVHLNLAKAKTLLDEAGGVKAVGQITLLYDTSDETATNTAMAVRDAWKHQLGIIAVMRSATAQELAEAVNRGEYIVALTTLTADRGDASGLLSWWQSGSSFHSTAYVMLLRAAEASGRVEVRDAYLEDAERMLVEDGWVIPLYYPHRHSGLGQHLTAPLYDGTGVYLFSGVVQQTPQ